MNRKFRLKPPKLPQLTENDVERQVLDALRWRQWRPERLQVGKCKSLDGRRFLTLHPEGTPDYVVTHALYPAFYLEVKRPGGSARPGQLQVRAELGLYGLAVVMVDGFEPLLVWLAEHERKARAKWREHAQ